uniref:Ras association domain family member 2b n=1 Tax=Eptatretus burgeri TaxID=7764 RepID=A0A8C4QZQ7_EPTBU
MTVYNTYNKGTPFELTTSDSGRIILEGYLQISWGIQTPLRLQLTDIFTPTISPSPCVAVMVHLLYTKKCLNMMQFYFSVLHNESGLLLLSAGTLIRTQSDVSTIRRPKRRSSAQKKVIQEHRVSVNGHFYNHKVCTWSTYQHIENSAEEFALYIVRANEERRKMSSHECPLVTRILEGPCVQVSRFYITEVGRAENVSHGVAQYINFEFHMLKTFLEKLAEEEQREVNKITTRYFMFSCPFCLWSFLCSTL